jgi:hypothetical protein
MLTSIYISAATSNVLKIPPSHFLSAPLYARKFASRRSKICVYTEISLRLYGKIFPSIRKFTRVYTEIYARLYGNFTASKHNLYASLQKYIIT